MCFGLCRETVGANYLFVGTFKQKGFFASFLTVGLLTV